MSGHQRLEPSPPDALEQCRLVIAEALAAELIRFLLGRCADDRGVVFDREGESRAALWLCGYGGKKGERCNGLGD